MASHKIVSQLSGQVKEVKKYTDKRHPEEFGSSRSILREWHKLVCAHTNVNTHIHTHTQSMPHMQAHTHN